MIDEEYEESVLENVLRDFVEQANANIEKIDAASGKEGAVETVRKMIDGATVVIGVFQDMDESFGVGIHVQPSGRWVILRRGRAPFELTSGDVFRVEVDRKVQITRIGHLWGQGRYSVDGYPLRDGMRAAIGVEALSRKNVRPRQALQVARRRLGNRSARPIARRHRRG